MSLSGTDAEVIRRSITSLYVARIAFIVWQMKEARRLIFFPRTNNLTHKTRAVALDCSFWRLPYVEMEN